MKIYPLVNALALAALMTSLHSLAHGFALPAQLPATLSGAALMLMFTGAALVFWSAGLFRSRDTTLDPQGKPSTLATDGLYRLSRNPMYLGMLLGLLGLALLLGNAWQLLGPALFVGTTSIQIRREEAVLEQHFGANYLNYKARVRRWI